MVASYLLNTGFPQDHPQTAGVPLVVGDELTQRCEGDLIRHKVRADGGALDPEVGHFPLTASCDTEGDCGQTTQTGPIKRTKLYIWFF